MGFNQVVWSFGNLCPLVVTYHCSFKQVVKKSSQLTFVQLLTYQQLMFEAVRSGFDGRVAIDDVAFVASPCTVPRMCSFEGQQCGYSSSGQAHWLHRSGHTTTISGPKTDHTLETELGK